MPIPAPNVAVISPGDGKPTRVGYKINADGSKVRICKRTGAEL
jgi:large subunit ribosomal protein L24